MRKRNIKNIQEEKTQDKSDLIDEIKQIIEDQHIHTHQELIDILQARGYIVNQSLISRTLSRIGISKALNGEGECIYHLPWEQSPPSPYHSVHSLIKSIEANEHTIVISTSPGAAPLVARIIDYEHVKLQILGTIAGDDVVFVAPKTIKEIALVENKIKTRFFH